MLFHTWTFALFFAVFYAVYLLVRNTRLRIPWLLAASYAFYGFCVPAHVASHTFGDWWNPAYVALVFYATVIDYVAVLGMSRTRWRLTWLWLSHANKLALLGYFKYSVFLVQSANAVLAPLTGWQIPVPEALLPVGISFFVFQSMTYTIDYYRGQVAREPNFFRHAAFVAMFPQLLAGPIERARNLLPQLRQAPRITREDLGDGLSLFVLGLFKKVALADYFALYVDKVYASPGSQPATALILATVVYAWQIYFDFSGYTDMARGIARLMGIRLMLNFDNPYLATSLGDFWRRWHISLSTWFRDYVYIPLGGNRHGKFRTYLNLCLTMVISGLWHGAMWTFVIWGALHALGSVATREMERSATYRDRVPRLVKQLGTFAFVSFAWIFFRARSFSEATLIAQRIAGGVAQLVLTPGLAADPGCPLAILAMVVLVWIYQYVYESRLRWTLEKGLVRTGLVVLMILYLATVASSRDQAFIYFQF